MDILSSTRPFKPQMLFTAIAEDPRAFAQRVLGLRKHTFSRVSSGYHAVWRI